MLSYRDILLIMTTLVIWSTITLNLSFLPLRRRLTGEMRTRLGYFLIFSQLILIVFLLYFLTVIFKVLPEEYFGAAFPVMGLIVHYRLKYLSSWSSEHSLPKLPYFTAGLLSLQLLHWALLMHVGWNHALPMEEIWTSDERIVQLVLKSTQVTILALTFASNLYPILLIRELKWRNVHLHLRVFILLNLLVFLIRLLWMANLIFNGNNILDNAMILTGIVTATFMTYLNAQISVDLRKPETLMSDLSHLNKLWLQVRNALPELIKSPGDQDLRTTFQNRFMMDEAELKNVLKINLHLTLNEFENYVRVERFLYRAGNLQDRHTLESIAQDCGFNSRSTLNRWINRFANTSPKMALTNSLENTELFKIRERCRVSNKS